MRMSKMYLHTLREVPSEGGPKSSAFASSRILKTGFRGIWIYAMGHRVLRKIEQIIREEMDARSSGTFNVSNSTC